MAQGGTVAHLTWKGVLLMHISQTGIQLIQHFEGCRLTAYQCPAGVWTIGWGTTEPINGVRPHKGMRITQAQADTLLMQHLTTYEQAVNTLVTYPIHQNQFDALVSFTYNCGKGALQTSTLLSKLNQGDVKGAAQEFLRWNKAGGKVLPGLIRRRTAERQLFLTLPEDPDYLQAIDTLVQANIITSPKLWQNHAYTSQHVRALFLKLSALLKNT